MSGSSGSQNGAPKREGVKFKVFDWNNSYINFNIFGMPNPNLPLFFMSASSGCKMKLLKGVKLKDFGWKVYINFNTFEDVKSESAINF